MHAVYSSVLYSTVLQIGTSVSNHSWSTWSIDHIAHQLVQCTMYCTVHLCVYLTASLSIRLFTCLSSSLSICLSIWLPDCPSACPLACTSAVYLLVYLCVYLSDVPSLFVSLSIWLSTSLFICLSICMSINCLFAWLAACLYMNGYELVNLPDQLPVYIHMCIYRLSVRMHKCFTYIICLFNWDKM